VSERAPLVDLRAARLNMGLSLNDAAQKIGVSRDTIERAEAGVGSPQPRNAFKIASFYGYQVTDVWPIEPEQTAGAAA
jgi:DNA-binding XRE family transcriptional regulator